MKLQIKSGFLISPTLQQQANPYSAKVSASGLCSKSHQLSKSFKFSGYCESTECLKKGDLTKIGEILLTKDATPGIAYVVKGQIEGIISSGILRLKILVQKSHQARLKAKQLLAQAKQEVESLIEK